MLFDRSFIDNITGLLRIGEPFAPMYQELVHRYRYGRRVFLVPPWPDLFTNDAERQHDFAAAVLEYESLVETYQAFGYDIVLIPQLPVAERVAWLETMLTTPQS